MTVHAVCRCEGSTKVLLVLNSKGKKTNKITKFRGWGVPGGGVNEGESARKAIMRELWEETCLSDDDCRIRDMPFRVTRKDGGHVDIWFLVEVDPWFELPETVDDPSGNIIQKPEWVDLVAFFFNNKRRFEGEIVYSSHIEAIKISFDKKLEAEEV